MEAGKSGRTGRYPHSSARHHAPDGKDATPKFGSIQVDITEDANLIQTETRKTNIRSIDFKLYRQRVQGALEPLFQQNPVLKKIRNGEPVTQAELDELAKLVLIRIRTLISGR